MRCHARIDAEEYEGSWNMADFIEGKRPVIEALRTGVPIKSILMADKNFHEKILEIAGNEYIEEFCSALWVHIARLDYLFFRNNTMGTSYNDHKLMIESFRIKDPFGAELAMKNNWNYSMLAVKAVNDKGSIA